MKEFVLTIDPKHDTPVGKLHPYWARKPLNLIEHLLELYSAPGDVVMDPFCGSGTSLLAALRTGRQAIASDISPLAVLLTKTTAYLQDAESIDLNALEKFIQQFEDLVLPWFQLESNLYVERERFDIVGDFENGRFELLPTESVVGERKNNSIVKKRSVSDCWLIKYNGPDHYLDSPIDFDSIAMLENSRIAIPKGAFLGHYFTERNKSAINLAISLIDKIDIGTKERHIALFLLSSAIPLLRLSDKKASSQWPYWRPKSHLTSRNPAVVLRKRFDALIKAIEWSQKLDDRDTSVYQCIIENLSIQDIVSRGDFNGKIDLIITDPPYSDHVPYLEYAAMWSNILGISNPQNAYEHELVNSNAVTRKNDSLRYVDRLSEAILGCAQLVRDAGCIVWFYQDRSLIHWSILYNAAISAGLCLEAVHRSHKQRRSMKTVTSPGRTLDGEMILVFRKSQNLRKYSQKVDVMLEIRASILRTKNRGLEEAAYVDYCVNLLGDSLLGGWIDQLALCYRDLFLAIDDNLNKEI